MNLTAVWCKSDASVKSTGDKTTQPTLLYVYVIRLLFIDSLHYFTCHTGAIDICELKAAYLLTRKHL